MIRKKFEKDLSLSHSDNGIAYKLSHGNVVEEHFGVSLDYIVADDDRMFAYLSQLNKDFPPETASRRANALRAYYRFKNRQKFPRLNSYVPTVANASVR